MCCITMPVVVPVKVDGEWRAMAKPGNVPCPNLDLSGDLAKCEVHGEDVYVESPCWIYGNPDADPDFEGKRGKPCVVGSMIRQRGGIKATHSQLVNIRLSKNEMEDLGSWKEMSGE